ncbi:hypothetical protein [Nocardiopsis sp. LOL_012]|uniref:hypothetical protein n=1 Tax=Nocardiopsis sp. LOL_012 TaxID=3345409 RepID=UPI003A8759FF
MFNQHPELAESDLPSGRQVTAGEVAVESGHVVAEPIPAPVLSDQGGLDRFDLFGLIPEQV